VLTTLLPSSLRKVILVSGKVYYDLLREIQIRSLQAEIGLVRLEEICPFPFKPLGEALRTLTSETSNLPEICWVQEEPHNQGAFGYVSPRISAVLEKLGWEGARLRYVGRRESEVPAVGVASMHAQEKNDIIQGALL
jgi:2-oxoadipate dehydrogenase E1 component